GSTLPHVPGLTERDQHQRSNDDHADDVTDPPRPPAELQFRELDGVSGVERRHSDGRADDTANGPPEEQEARDLLPYQNLEAIPHEPANQPRSRMRLKDRARANRGRERRRW